MKTNIYANTTAQRTTLSHTLALNVLVLLGLAILATGLFAQTSGNTSGNGPGKPFGGKDRPDPQKLTERRVNHLKKALKLTDEQTGKIQPIILKGAETGKKIFEDNKGNRQAMADAMKTSMEATDKEIRAILTAEQQTKFDEMRGKMKAKMEERMKHRKEKKADTK